MARRTLRLSLARREAPSVRQAMLPVARQAAPPTTAREPTTPAHRPVREPTTPADRPVRKPQARRAPAPAHRRAAPPGRGSAGTTSATPTGGTGVTPAAGTAAGTTPTAAPSGAATTPAAATPAAAATPVAAAPAGAPGGTIVPLYTPPSDPSWNTVIAGKAAPPAGERDRGRQPGQRPRRRHEQRLRRVGISKLASPASRSSATWPPGTRANAAAAVKADIDRWQSFYPGQISGIFFDEQSNKPERRRVLPRPVAVREVAGAVVHRRQPRHRHRGGLRRRARRDADLRERRRAVGGRDGRLAHEATRRRTSA